jgi:Right handed beta helix region
MHARIYMLALLALFASWTGCRRAEPASAGGDVSAKKLAPTLATSAPSAAPTCPIRVEPVLGDNWSRLQAAIEAASSGDCGDVLLGPGVFELSQPVQLRSGVRLSGQRFKKSFSTLRPSRAFRGDALLLTKFAPDTAERKQVSFYLENLLLDARPGCPTPKDCPKTAVEVGLWLENAAYPTIRDCEFARFPESGAAIRGAGILYLKLMDNRFLGNLGWSVDLALEYAPRKEPDAPKRNTYYAVSVGTIQRNYFATRRGIRLTPGYAVTISDNQFEGGLSMIHAHEAASSVLVIENNYFELSRTPQDIPNRGSIAIRGSGRISGNLLNGPSKGKLPRYEGPGIEVLASNSMTIQDNTIRCFDPAVRVTGGADPARVRDGGNLIGPKGRIETAWDFPGRNAAPEPADEALDQATE